MCGIFGIVLSEDTPELGRILVDAGKRLTYRGYDSVGTAVISGGSDSIDLRKDVGTVEEVARKYNLTEMTGIRGIVQLRWATFGIPAQVNAQPHLDCSGELVGAHNGNIVNTIPLRQYFRENGHEVRGMNDGEMVVHSVEEKIAGDHSRTTVRRAVIESDRQLRGDYAFVFTHIHDNIMYAAKKGSSLYLGIGDGFICASSDLPSLLPLTRNIVHLEDGDFVEFTPTEYRIFDIRTGAEVRRTPRISSIDLSSIHKGEYDHFMHKEIHEQPRTVRNMLHLLEESPFVKPFLQALHDADHIFFVASGSSYNAAVNGACYFNKLAHLPVVPVIAGQFIESFGTSLTPDTVLVCISQSGETKDLINVVNYARDQGKGHILGIVNVQGSTLMNRSEVYLPLACDLEVSVPATKTFMNQVTMLLYLACRSALSRGIVNRHDPQTVMLNILGMPEKIAETIAATEEPCRRLGTDLSAVNDIYSLGYGVCHGTALEGALKIKEITYAHCEGMYSSEFKHGPLSIVTTGYPVIYPTVTEDADMIISHMNEVSCREGRVIVISTPCEAIQSNASDLIEVPGPSDPFTASIQNVIPLQLIAYFWAVAKGNDPDFPRNLSKTLTVD